MTKGFSDDPEVEGESEAKVTFELIISNSG